MRCLTPKENLVYELLLTGLSYKAIASRLKMSQRTVNCHASTIYSKLGVTSQSGGLLKLQQFDNFDAPATHLCKSKEQRIKVYQLKKRRIQNRRNCC